VGYYFCVQPFPEVLDFCFFVCFSIVVVVAAAVVVVIVDYDG
jgi:hypothetical protein